MSEHNEIIKKVMDELEARLSKNGIVRINRGVEKEFGVTRTKFRFAVDNLVRNGCKIRYAREKNKMTGMYLTKK